MRISSVARAYSNALVWLRVRGRGRVRDGCHAGYAMSRRQHGDLQRLSKASQRRSRGLLWHEARRCTCRSCCSSDGLLVLGQMRAKWLISRIPAPPDKHGSEYRAQDIPTARFQQHCIRAAAPSTRDMHLRTRYRGQTLILGPLLRKKSVDRTVKRTRRLLIGRVVFLASYAAYPASRSLPLRGTPHRKRASTPGQQPIRLSVAAQAKPPVCRPLDQIPTLGASTSLARACAPTSLLSGLLSPVVYNSLASPCYSWLGLLLPLLILPPSCLFLLSLIPSDW